jgi:hypothetical protein
MNNVKEACRGEFEELPEYLLRVPPMGWLTNTGVK